MAKASTPRRRSIYDTSIPVPVIKSADRIDPSGYRGGNRKHVSLGQMAVLLWHLYRCVNDPDVGYLDANFTLQELLSGPLNKAIWLEVSMLERLLWAANESNELGLWWSPNNKSFNEFTRDFLKSDTEVYDKFLNYFIELDDDSDDDEEKNNTNKLSNRYVKNRKVKR